MGQRGPLPQPDNVRQLRGNPGKRKSKPVVQPVRGIPEPPDLPAEALAEWKRITPELGRLSLVAHIDRGKLVNYCIAWDRYLKAAEAIEKVEGTPDRWTWQQYRDASMLVDSLGKDLYLSPGARARLSVPEPESKDDGVLD